jgi:sugar transferase (PEP-CTERM system associated)
MFRGLARHLMGGAAIVEFAIVALVVGRCLVVPTRSVIIGYWLGLGVAALTIFALGAMGLYNLRQRVQFEGVIIRVFAAATGVLALSVLLEWLFIESRPSPVVFVLPFSLTFMALVGSRFLLAVLLNWSALKRRVLVYGAGRRALAVGGLRRRSDRRGFVLLGFVPAEGAPVTVPAAQQLDLDVGLTEFCAINAVDEIVVAIDERRAGLPIAELLECRLRGIIVRDVVDFLEAETGRVTIPIVTPSWFLFSKGFDQALLRKVARRIFDVTARAVLLVLSLPVVLAAVVAIKIEEGVGAPIFYRQRRVGLAGRVFDVFKLRTMRVDAEREGRAVWATINDRRVTRVGALLRRSRIDELPQLFNVLIGDMSVVGPRPERPEFVERLSQAIPYYSERHIVKPGITGWAQVSYPYGASDADSLEKLQYDLYYIKHNSLGFDLSVLMQTIEVVLFGQGSR